MDETTTTIVAKRHYMTDSNGVLWLIQKWYLPKNKGYYKYWIADSHDGRYSIKGETLKETREKIKEFAININDDKKLFQTKITNLSENSQKELANKVAQSWIDLEKKMVKQLISEILEPPHITFFKWVKTKIKNLLRRK